MPHGIAREKATRATLHASKIDYDSGISDISDDVSCHRSILELEFLALFLPLTWQSLRFLH